MEKWVAIPGWEGLYECSSEGRIRSHDRACNARNGAKAVRKGRVLAAVPKSGRYLCVTLARGSERRQYFIHDLVALSFHGPKAAGFQTCHCNGDLRDNRADNLRYDTVQANNNDKKLHGTVAKGETHGMAKLSKDQVLRIRCSNERSRTLADLYGISTEHVWAIRARRVWAHI